MSTKVNLTLSIKGEVTTSILNYIQSLKKRYSDNKPLLEDLDNILKAIVLGTTRTINSTYSSISIIRTTLIYY